MNEREWIHVGTGLAIAVLLAGIMIISAGAMGIAGHVSPPQPRPEPNITYIHDVILDTALPPSPASIPVYRVTSVRRVSFGSPDTLTIKKRIPPTADAPGLAKKNLEPYGGLPADAVLERTEQAFMKKYNLATDTVEEQYPQNTRVVYRQYLNGSLVLRSGIEVTLGENGEALAISERWPAFEPNGEVPVISAEEALTKLNAREMVEKLQCDIGGMHIMEIRPGYYVDLHQPDASAQALLPDTCTPVWIFYATKPGTGEPPFPLMVNATRG